MTGKTDKTTLALITQIKQQKAEIAKADRPNWLTNCSFAYHEESSAIINLHVESNVRTLTMIAAFLLDKEEAYNKAAAVLGIEKPVKFIWAGFSTGEWIADLRTRLNKIQVVSKRKKLEALEERLNKIISPELRAEMELEAITNELGR